MRPIAALILAMAAAGTAAAQPSPPASVRLDPGGAILNVTAEGRSRRQPDLATFNAGVVTRGKTAAEALAANARRMDAVIAALKRAGVADRDLQTSTLSLQPQYYYPPQRPISGGASEQPAAPEPPRIIGYEARNTVTARVRKIDDVGSIVDALVKAGSNQVDGPYFTIENQDAATDEARAQAMAVARQRAELYARSADLKVGRILTITEGGGYFPVQQQVILTGSMAGAPPPAPPPPPPPGSSVQAGELTVSASLSVQFALER